MEDKVLAQIDEYEEFLKEYEEESEEDDGPAGLQLDGVPFKAFTPKIRERIEKLGSIESMTLNNCKLNSLDNLPKIESLTKLDLSDNKINGKDLEKLCIYPKLESLMCAGSNVKTQDELRLLKPLTKLVQQDLFNSPVTNVENYREEVFKIFPELLILDFKNKDGEEVNESDDEDDEDDEEDEEGEQGEDGEEGEESGVEEVEDYDKEDGFIVDDEEEENGKHALELNDGEEENGNHKKVKEN